MEVEEGDGGSGSGSAAAALEAAERRRLEEEEEDEDEDEDEEAFLPPFFLELEVEGSLLAMMKESVGQDSRLSIGSAKGGGATRDFVPGQIR